MNMRERERGTYIDFFNTFGKCWEYNTESDIYVAWCSHVAGWVSSSWALMQMGCRHYCFLVLSGVNMYMLWILWYRYMTRILLHWVLLSQQAGKFCFHGLQIQNDARWMGYAMNTIYVYTYICAQVSRAKINSYRHFFHPDVPPENWIAYAIGHDMLMSTPPSSSHRSHISGPTCSALSWQLAMHHCQLPGIHSYGALVT